jgi:hypothetical protein
LAAGKLRRLAAIRLEHLPVCKHASVQASQQVGQRATKPAGTLSCHQQNLLCILLTDRPHGLRAVVLAAKPASQKAGNTASQQDATLSRRQCINAAGRRASRTAVWIVGMRCSGPAGCSVFASASQREILLAGFPEAP